MSTVLFVFIVTSILLAFVFGFIVGLDYREKNPRYDNDNEGW